MCSLETPKNNQLTRLFVVHILKCLILCKPCKTAATQEGKPKTRPAVLNHGETTNSQGFFVVHVLKCLIWCKPCKTYQSPSSIMPRVPTWWVSVSPMKITWNSTHFTVTMVGCVLIWISPSNIFQNWIFCEWSNHYKVVPFWRYYRHKGKLYFSSKKPLDILFQIIRKKALHDYVLLRVKVFFS